MQKSVAEKSLANEQPLGIVTGKAEPHRLSFLASRPVHVGEYIEVEGPQGRLLGLVERCIVQSSLLDSVENYQAAMEARSVASKSARDKMYLGGVRVLGLVEDLRVGNVYLPSVTPPPGAEVREARKSVLRGVFSKEG